MPTILRKFLAIAIFVCLVLLFHDHELILFSMHL